MRMAHGEDSVGTRCDEIVGHSNRGLGHWCVQSSEYCRSGRFTYKWSCRCVAEHGVPAERQGPPEKPRFRVLGQGEYVVGEGCERVVVQSVCD